jgi:hypothetical protein
MPDPKIIDSPLSCVFKRDGQSVDVRIFRLEDTEWSLEIVASDNSSTVWDDLFASDEAALTEALKAIEEDGIGSFSEIAATKKGAHH